MKMQHSQALSSHLYNLPQDTSVCAVLTSTHWGNTLLTAYHFQVKTVINAVLLFQKQPMRDFFQLWSLFTTATENKACVKCSLRASFLRFSFSLCKVTQQFSGVCISWFPSKPKWQTKTHYLASMFTLS